MARPFIAAATLIAAFPVAIAGVPAVHAGESGAVQACAKPEVLALVSDRLQRAGVPPRMETRSIGQAPGPTPGIVLCAVWVHRLVFDTPRLGPAPADVLVAYYYSLQLRQNAAFLLPER